ncbi:MAG: hypothetical protein OEY51_12685 [Cyclobacteriaceae bacterium]|nr:hypothetical protein [Cyclobacteriaceae bacterium]
MKRIHLFEFEDLWWFPSFLRNYGTGFLQFLSNKTRMYNPIIPIIEKGLTKSGTNQIIDLGSGGGGGLLRISEILKEKGVKVVLTDYFPNIDAFEYTKSLADNISFEREPVDARKVPLSLKGFRTQFLSFHHFQPSDAKLILQNAVSSRQGILIVEAQERSFPSLVTMFFSPLMVLITTPFIRPFSWGRILFTYLIPLVPLFVWWDGLVSSLRTYSLNELNALIQEVDSQGKFDWESGRLKSGPGIILYLLGTVRYS